MRDLERLSVSILRLLEQLPYQLACELEGLQRERERGSVRDDAKYVQEFPPNSGAVECDQISGWPQADQGSFLRELGDWVFAHPEENDADL